MEPFGLSPRPLILRGVATLALAMTAVGGHAADITGTITVKQRLTRPSVTAAVSMYERGPAVELGKDAESDPLAAERARVVIWVEGEGSVLAPETYGEHAAGEPAIRSGHGSDTAGLVGLVSEHGSDLP